MILKFDFQRDEVSFSLFLSHPSALSCINATQSPIAGAAALVVGIAAAWFGASLFQVSVSCCAVVLVLELFLVH